MIIKFTKHARFKFVILKTYGFPVSEKQVLRAIKFPDKKEKGKDKRLISQINIDEKHVLRVVYEKVGNKITVITFYPGMKKQYES